MTTDPVGSHALQNERLNIGAHTHLIQFARVIGVNFGQKGPEFVEKRRVCGFVEVAGVSVGADLAVQPQFEQSAHAQLYRALHFGVARDLCGSQLLTGRNSMVSVFC